jgi:acyl-CoA thioesterase-1
LILHAKGDRRVPLPMGKMFYQALLSRKVPTQMVLYPDEGHGIRQPKHAVDVLERTLAWFAAHDVGAEQEIVLLGDSITKGVRSGVTAEQTFAGVVDKRLRDLGWPVKTTNVGIGGERTDQALVRLDKEVIANEPQIVTIMYGTNDSYVDSGRDGSRISVEAYRENLKQLVERIRSSGATPVLMTEPRWGAAAKPNGLGEHPNERLEQFMHACRDVARETKTPLVEHYAPWLSAEEAGQELGQWTTDQCHPNAAGHAQIAELLVPVLRGVLLPDPALAPQE